MFPDLAGVLLLVSLLNGLDQPKPFPSVPSRKAWNRMPREAPALPVWARTLVVPQPKTTAGVLALDYLHRAKNPLGNALAAKVRWAVADQLKCDYACQYALADLERFAKPKEAKKFRSGTYTDDETLILKFARKLTKEGYRISDAEVAELLKRLGPDKLTALVHTVAFANFHDRILIGLGVSIPKDGSEPLPPVEIAYNPQTPATVTAPPRPGWITVQTIRTPVTYSSPEDWREVTFEELESALAQQKARAARVPLPDASRFANLPPPVKKQTDSIVWMTISAGYQPEMTMAWFAAFRSFQEEGRSDRVFTSSLFWIVTRANDCFY